ncbi:MAG: PilZ domain-containing protein [Vulcanimicrobiota bacterium]
MESSENRRLFPRVEHVVHGWYRLGQEKFRRCKTLDMSLQGALLVVDHLFAPEEKRFELHLDLDADWQIALFAEPLWQRPIFFGKQFLTAVTYKFKNSQDKSMFGLWVQRSKTSDGERPDYLEPPRTSPMASKSSFEEELHVPSKVVTRTQRWRQLLANVRAVVPWVDEEKLLKCRRREPRIPVGMRLRLLHDGQQTSVELLNISRHGLRVYVEQPSKLRNEAVLILDEDSLLVGRRRLKVTRLWDLETERSGRVFGMGLAEPAEVVDQSWLGDLLRRLQYDLVEPRQALRLPVSVPVRVLAEDREILADGETVDIGLGGALLEVDAALPVGNTVVVSMCDGEEINFDLLARVLHQDASQGVGFRYGVAFFKGRSQSHLQLSRALSKRARWWSLDSEGRSPAGPATLRSSYA